jgi:hypothetical protein
MSMGARSWSIVAGTVAVLCACAGLIGTTAAVAAAWNPVPPTTPGGLSLDSSMSPVRIPELSPGDPAYWQIRTRVDHEGHFGLSLELRKDGALVTRPDGLGITITACDNEWQHMTSSPTCAAPHPVLAAGPADTMSGQVFTIHGERDDGQTYLLVELSLPDTAAARSDPDLMGLSATVGLGITAADSPTAVTATPTPSAPATTPAAVPMPGPTTIQGGSDRAALAFTGSDVLGPALLALALLLAGVASRLRRRPNSENQ